MNRTRFEVKNPEEECILCGLCVRACSQVVGANAISTVGRGAQKEIGSPYLIPGDDCIACGTCVTVCPTGAMRARFDRVRGVPAVVMARSGK